MILEEVRKTQSKRKRHTQISHFHSITLVCVCTVLELEFCRETKTERGL